MFMFRLRWTFITTLHVLELSFLIGIAIALLAIPWLLLKRVRSVVATARKTVPLWGLVKSILRQDVLRITRGSAHGERLRVPHFDTQRFAHVEADTLVNGVFSGGGAKCYAHICALEAMQDHGHWFKAVSGASAGSLVAALVAAGFSVATIKSIMFQMDMAGLLINPPTSLLYSLLTRWGFFCLDAYAEWLDALFEGRTFQDVDLELHIVAYDLTYRELLVLNRLNTPNLKISEAVRMSCNIPIFFTAVKWLGTGKYANGIERIVVDGGLICNTPSFIFDERGEFHKTVLFVFRDE